MPLCINKFSLQDSIDFMTLTSRDLSRHDVILATLVKFIKISNMVARSKQLP